MRDFYSREYDEFTEMVEKQKISLSNFLDSDERLTEKQHSDLYDATIVHDKPLTNALGANFKSILDREKVAEMFNQMVSISEWPRWNNEGYTVLLSDVSKLSAQTITLYILSFLWPPVEQTSVLTN